MAASNRAPDPHEEALRTLFARVREHLRSLAARPVHEALDPRALGQTLARFDLSRGGAPPAAAVETLATLLARGTLHTGHPSHFGFANPGADPLSLLGDGLAALFDPQLALRESAPAALALEHEALGALARAARLPYAPGASSFTNGASESTLTALALALARAHPSYATDGLFGMRARPRVYSTEHAHRSVTKAARILGLGDRSVCEIAAPAPHFAMSVAALKAQLARDRAEGHGPLAVVATVGTTVAGALDPVEALASLCAREGLWLHVDAAWAGGFALSPSFREAHLSGLARADSVAWDAHKWPGLSLGTGMLFCAAEGPARALFTVEAPYMRAPSPDAPPQPYATTAQWSRRAAGLKVYLSLAVRGTEALAREAERQLALGERLRMGLTSSGYSLANETPLPVACAEHPALAGRHAQVTRALRARANAWLSCPELTPGRRVLRAAVVSPRTTETEVDALVTALAGAL